MPFVGFRSPGARKMVNLRPPTVHFDVTGGPWKNKQIGDCSALEKRRGVKALRRSTRLSSTEPMSLCRRQVVEGSSLFLAIRPDLTHRPSRGVAQR